MIIVFKDFYNINNAVAKDEGLDLAESVLLSRKFL